jgi:hypothetical protein
MEHPVTEQAAAGGRTGPGTAARLAAECDTPAFAGACLPVAGSRWITVLGCASRAGQSVTALMAGHVLAALRGIPVAALDLNPGQTSLAARVAPAACVTALLASQDPDTQARPAAGTRPAAGDSSTQPVGDNRGPRLDVIAASPPGHGGWPTLGAANYQRLACLLAARYPLTIIDPAPAALPVMLPLTDQLLLVTAAGSQAADALASTQRWLAAHGYHELAARAVTVINKVTDQASPDVLQADTVARERCRAIVRVHWDDLVSVRPDATDALPPLTRIAYIALARMLVTGLALKPSTPVPGGSGPGGRSR